MFFDSWFASLPLFTTPAKFSISALGTVKPNRFIVKREGSGSLVEMEVCINGTDVKAFKRYDNRGVALETIFDSAHLYTTCDDSLTDLL